LLTSQFNLLIVGARLGTAAVTPFSIANRLVSYGIQLVSTGTSVLTPVSAELHAAGHEEKQHRIFLEGGRLCLAFTLFFTYCFLFLGRPLILLWMGPRQASAIPLLYIQAIGETLSVSHLVTISLVLGKGHPRLLALINLCDSLAAVALALALAAPLGLIGITLGYEISATLLRGVGVMYFGARLIGVPLRRYFLETVVPGLAITAAPAAILAAATAWHAPTTWTELFLFGGAFSILYAAFCIPLIGTERIQRLVRRVVKTTASAKLDDWQTTESKEIVNA
jgi:O-antigen/teichoic acid export membrane protein